MKLSAPLLSLIVLLSGASFSARAQFTVSGTLTDSLTGDRLIGANVYLLGTALGGVTDREGAFRILHVPAATYTVRFSYVGYRTVERACAVSGDVRLAVRLLPDVVEGEEVVVTGQRRGQLDAINQQLSSKIPMNVISEEKIKELPDANAAEAIGRLPGISIIRSGGEANKVILRGMSDKFTTFTIDGARIPPTDPDQRGVDLSTFSQGTLAGVEVYKALTSDQDADAIAGSINLVTRKAPSVRTVRIDAKGAYNRLTRNAGQFEFNGKYGERFFDNILGVQVTGNIERRDRSNEQFSTDIENLRALGQLGLQYNDLTVNYTDEIRKRGGAGLLLDVATPDSGSIRFNALYNRTDRNYIVYGRDYPVAASVSYTARDREQNINTFNGALRGENNLFSLSVNWGASFAESKSETPYDFRMSFLEPSIPDSSGMRPVPQSAQRMPPEALIPYAFNNFQKAFIDTADYDTEKNFDREKTVFLDLSRKYVLGNLFSGEVKLGGKYRHKNRFKASTEMLAPYYLSYFQDYVRNPDGSVSPKNFAGTRFANLQMSGRNILLPNFLGAPPADRTLFDKYALNPLMERDALRLWYDLNKNGVGLTGQSEYYDNPEVDADYYNIVERVQAAYLMNTLDFGPLVTLIMGVRVEKEQNDYAAKYVNTPLAGFPTTGILLDTTSTFDETFWLPNFHLAVRPTDFLTVRLAAYRAIARPDFNARLLKNVIRKSNPRDILVFGNPDLKNAKAWNYEASTSVYSTHIGLFTVSAYLRVIDNMFHTVTGIIGTNKALLDTLGITWRPQLPPTDPVTLTYSTNTARPTKVWGFEFEHQANLTWLPGLLANTVLSYNFSFVRSETYVLSYRIDTTYIVIPPFPPIADYHAVVFEAKQKLEGQPEFFGNVALGYDIGGFSGRLSVFFQGEYNRSYSASGQNDPVVKPFSRWDLSLRQRLTPNISVFFNLNNFTSVVEDVWTMDRPAAIGLLRSSQRYGLSSDLGVRFEM